MRGFVPTQKRRVSIVGVFDKRPSLTRASKERNAKFHYIHDMNCERTPVPLVRFLLGGWLSRTFWALGWVAGNG